MIVEVDLTPEPHALKSMRNTDMSPESACAELIDNAFDAQASFVSFDFNSNAKTLTVVDDGLGTSDIKSIVKIGSHNNEGRSTSGRYGVGGKDAILSFGSMVEITSTRNKIQRTMMVDFEQMERSNNWKAFAEEPVIVSDSIVGTTIKIKNLRKEYCKTSVLMRKLEALFSPALKAGKVIIVNGVQLKPVPPIVVENELSGECEFDDKKFRWYGGIKPKGMISSGGWTIAFKHRIIKESAAYGMGDLSAYRFYGMIELVENEGEAKWELTKHKNSLSELEDLCEYIFDTNPELGALLKSVNSKDSVELQTQQVQEISENITQGFLELENIIEKRKPPKDMGKGLSNNKGPDGERLRVTRHQAGNKTLKALDKMKCKTFVIQWEEDSPVHSYVQGNRHSNIVHFGALHPFWVKYRSNNILVQMSGVYSLVIHAVTTEDNDQPILSCMSMNASAYHRAFETIDAQAAVASRQN